MISKKLAVKKAKPGLKKPGFFWDKGTSLKQAIGKHTDVNQTSVQPAAVTTTSMASDRGSTMPQSPDPAAVTRGAIAARVGKPPKFHDAGMTPTYKPPRDAGTSVKGDESRGPVYQHVKKKLRGRNTFA